ncbi:hypothetical protein GCM10008915_03550 [Bifidobacterium pullorum subsp. gallinarum]
MWAEYAARPDGRLIESRVASSSSDRLVTNSTAAMHPGSSSTDSRDTVSEIPSFHDAVFELAAL